MTLATTEPDYARDLTDRIKIAVEGTWELIKEAYVSRAWEALGYRSWDDYCTREFGTSRLRLPREERQEVVASLRESGLSIRAIAAATGDSVGTVHDALGSGVQDRTPDPDPAPFDPQPIADELAAFDATYDDDGDDDPPLTQDECEALADPDDLDDEPAPRVTGTDGRSYPATRPKKSNRKPITDSFWTATYDLGKKVNTLTNLAADDRFTKNADQIRDRNLNDLIRARDALQCVIDQLTN